MNWPIVGMLPSLLVNMHRPHDWGAELLIRQSAGCSYWFEGPWFGHMDCLTTVDLADVRYILNTNFSNFPKGPEFKEIFDVLGDGIFNSDMELWRSQRKVGHALINHPSFHRFLEKTIREKVRNGLFPVLDHLTMQGRPVDLQDVFKRFTFDTTQIFLAGVDPACLAIEMPKVPVAEAFDDVLQIIFYRLMSPLFVWKLQRLIGTGIEKRLGEARDTLDRFIETCISKKREQLLSRGDEVKEGVLEGIDLLTSYLVEEEAKGLRSDKLLRDTIMNYMVAGRDTVSSALTWFFWLLSENPTAEAKIVEELKAISQKKKNPSDQEVLVFDTKELNKLVYLHGALCECLRLFPPVPFQLKTPIEQDILPSGHTVNPKSRVLISMYAMGRMEEIWGKDCLEFKPERWVCREGRVKYEPPYKFLAFNAGPRICLGKEVAFTQMKLVVATLIYNYHFEAVEGHSVVPKNSIILHMKDGLLVRIKRRVI
ncbi:hypothetical protein Scep_000892 [Stephania cephalantha]|uniref:Cytochrome P450 n=1 Tax=Stephania cephalantha TaxID=152367 RepID=A0AAP0Q761_9MAGN